MTLRIVEGFFKEKGRRKFDVVIEGLVVLPGYEPLADAGFGIPKDFRFEAPVMDGVLDLDFRSLVENPTISALKVRRLDDDASGGG